jgi:hypothetical protein
MFTISTKPFAKITKSSRLRKKFSIQASARLFYSIMSRRSKKHRQEKVVSPTGKAVPAATGIVATRSAGQLFPPEIPSVRKKWLLFFVAAVEACWISFLLYLVIRK